MCGCLNVVGASPTILSFYPFHGAVVVVVVAEIVGEFKLFVIDENWWCAETKRERDREKGLGGAWQKEKGKKEKQKKYPTQFNSKRYTTHSSPITKVRRWTLNQRLLMKWNRGSGFLAMETLLGCEHAAERTSARARVFSSRVHHIAFVSFWHFVCFRWVCGHNITVRCTRHGVAGCCFVCVKALVIRYPKYNEMKRKKKSAAEKKKVSRAENTIIQCVEQAAECYVHRPYIVSYSRARYYVRTEMWLCCLRRKYIPAAASSTTCEFFRRNDFLRLWFVGNTRWSVLRIT